MNDTAGAMGAPTAAAGRSNYRPDIDGLRAVAIIAVIVYHLKQSWLPGGFVGVDIFFVISGFLITSLIRLEIAAGTFSYVRFYARRVRRIYPALLVMMAVTLAAGYFLLVPKEYIGAAWSALAAAFGFSNFYFLGTIDYFADKATTMPLLHTWSLGVEEQFYFAWPLLLALAFALRARARVWPVLPLALVVAASFGLSALWWAQDPDTAFYSPFSRAWELGLGALVAYAPNLRGHGPAQGAALAGVLAVAFALLQPNYGQLATVSAACIGAALLVWPKNEWEIVSGALSLPPLRFIGRISYSLYLWHWPLLVFLRSDIVFRNDFGPVGTLLYLLAVIAVATLSWRFVEQPLRGPAQRPWRAIGYGLVVSGGLAACCALLAWQGGLPQRYPPNVVRYLSFDGVPKQRADAYCHLVKRSDWPRYEENKCITFEEERANVLLLGDSHANHYFAALVAAFPNVNFSQASASGCQPEVQMKGSEPCPRLARLVLEKYIPKGRFDAVILSGRWGKKSVPKMAKTVAALRKTTPVVFVLGPNPEYSDRLSKLLALGVWREASFIANQERNGNLRSVEKDMRDKTTASGATYYSVLDIICPKRHCQATTQTDEPMLSDSNHLTLAGSRYVVDALKAQGMLAGLTPAHAKPPAGAPPR